MSTGHLKLIAKIEPMRSWLIGRFKKEIGNALFGADILTGSTEFGRSAKRVRRTIKRSLEAVLMAA
jgi:hypothetical protein